MEEYVVYALYSVDFDKIYIGYTSDLLNRMRSHSELGKGDFTSKFRPWKVVYVEFCKTKHMAMSREKQLKSARGRKFIRESLIER